MTSLCVYCGSSFGVSDAYAAAATELGTLCARRGITIVYGGGGVGLMGLLADAALAAGGKVIGVIPYAMVAEERGHRGLTELIPVNTMHERKARMAELADAFVALPGGIGTLEEVIEAYTWLQLGLQIKPVALLNVGGFYDPLVRFLDHACGEGFLSPRIATCSSRRQSVCRFWTGWRMPASSRFPRRSTVSMDRSRGCNG